MREQDTKEKSTRKRGYELHIPLMLFDMIASNLVYGFALWLRFEFQFSRIPREYLMGWWHMIPVQAVIIFVLFLIFRLYKSMWKYAGFEEVEYLAVATVIAAILHAIISKVFFIRMPMSYYILGWLLEFLVLTTVRYTYRILVRIYKYHMWDKVPRENIMIIGAGEAARILIRELKSSNQIAANICCIIDDDKKKCGKFLNGIQVVGNRYDILKNVEKYHIQKIILAIPTIKPKERRDILNICKETECQLQSLPGIYQLVNNEVTVNNLRNVSVEELLGRDTVEVNLAEIMEYVKGKVVLVTGGGGSIGSELCRQIAGYKPERLIIFDIYENNAYDIQQELKHDFPELDLHVLIGSVRDIRRIQQVFEMFRPEIVYHAAAHKHVPLMEYSPNEAIKNNVLGTYNTAMVADKYKTKRFVLISTDKAVNPVNIMGASKRLCEMVIQSINKKSDTEYVAVRFGNVLGSNGSVIPLFKRQIEKGGPVTVTHPDIIRYFMTIPEAVSLVLQAGVYAKGGEIFILDMGEPVKIDDLAKNLIRLSGHIPGEDISIQYTGLREGEKMYEECLKEEEGLEKTENQLIFVGKPVVFDSEWLLEQIPRLTEASYGNSTNIKELVKELVPSYQE